MKKLLLSLTAFVTLAASTSIVLGADEPKKLLLAEPQHGIGYLPVYVAVKKGFYKEEGLEVETAVLEGASGSTNAILTQQVFGSIGGPEHNGVANEKGATLRAVVNLVNRGNVYLVAKAGSEPKQGEDPAAYVRGKSIAMGLYGGTPNTIVRYMLKKWALEPEDVVLREMATSTILPAMKSGVADIAVVSDPALSRGVAEGVWSAPFLSIPNALGPYAYSAINIDQQMIASDPQTVEKFVRATLKGLSYVQADHDGALQIAAQEFPTLEADALKTTMNRAYADKLWSEDGKIAPEAWDLAEDVVIQAGLLKEPSPYDQVIDMQFVIKAGAEN